MTFDDIVIAAAKAADKAVSRSMNKYASGLVTDEDDLTGILLGNLDAAFSGEIGGLNWSTSVVRHRRGIAAEERRVGADILIHVTFQTNTHSYSKGVLVQAKRIESGHAMSRASHQELIAQCQTMLQISPAAFVFNYTKVDMRCGSASKIAGAVRRNLHAECSWTSYRFFLELFRCSIGDPRLTSARVSRLPVSMQAENEFSILAEGTLTIDPYHVS